MVDGSDATIGELHCVSAAKSRNRRIIRRLSRLLFAAIFAAFFVSIGTQIRAHQLFGFSKKVESVPASVVLTIKAWKLFPWDFQIRQQLFVTLSRAMDSDKIRLDRSAYELAWKVSASASPYFLLISKHKRQANEVVFNNPTPVPITDGE